MLLKYTVDYPPPPPQGAIVSVILSIGFFYFLGMNKKRGARLAPLFYQVLVFDRMLCQYTQVYSKYFGIPARLSCSIIINLDTYLI